MTTLSERIAQDQITATATYRDQGGPSYAADMHDMDWWDVTLQYDGRRMLVPFGMGRGHHGAEPTAYDVLQSLVLDAAGTENARDYEDWASEYGYDEDSRSGVRAYEQTVKQTGRLRAFLGDLYDAYLWETDND